jgi:hypothetical protein
MQVELDMIERATIRKALANYFANAHAAQEKAEDNFTRNTYLIEKSRAESLFQRFQSMPKDTD